MTERKSKSEQGKSISAQPTLPDLFGPYEYWNFDSGKEYAFPPIKREFRFLTSMASISTSFELPPGPIQKGPDSKNPAWFPTLWRPNSGHIQTSPLKVNFLPYIIGSSISKKKGKQESGLAFGFQFNFDLRIFLNFFLSGIEQLLGKSFRKTVQKIRVAFPVSNAAMNPDVQSEPNDPVPCTNSAATGNCTENPWIPDPTIKKWVADNKSGPDKKHLTVIAVIDDGIPFAHRNFRSEDGERSRIEFCWMQSVAKDTSAIGPTVTFGREYLRHDIEELITENSEDEDFLYQTSGALADDGNFGSILSRHATHGAHVMDQACGYSPEQGDNVREEIRIIAVQLPNELTLDTSGFGKDAYILSAMHYILNRADILEKEYGVENLRLVTNLSFGFSAGRIDGKSDIEFALDQLIDYRRNVLKKPTALVMPAGNSFLSRLHAQFSENNLLADNSFSLNWNIQPNDRTSSYLEVWFPVDFDPTNYELSAVSPVTGASTSISISKSDTANRASDMETFKNSEIKSDLSGQTVGFVSFDQRKIVAEEDVGGKTKTKVIGKRWRMMVVLAPTEPETPEIDGASPGIWKITVSRNLGFNSLSPGQLIHCRIQRDENINSSFSGAKQSYIEDENNVLFDDLGRAKEFDSNASHVKRFDSLNGLATGRNTLIVGGFKTTGAHDWNLKNGIPSSFSSAGPVYDRLSPNVDCAALADRSNVLPGTIAAATKSGSFSQLQGTSSAAPFVACAIAEAFSIATNVQVTNAKDSNYLELITGMVDGLNTQYVDVSRSNDPFENNSWVSKARLGEFMIIPKQNEKT